jgi:hypothetical protein
MENDMTDAKYVKNWSCEISRFSQKLKQVRYRGTWRWNVGYTDNLMPSFPIFFVDKSSHGYKKLKYGTGHKGPVIKTRAEAMRQAQAALTEAKANDDK